MKHLIAITASILFALTLFPACGGDDDDDNGDDTMMDAAVAPGADAAPAHQCLPAPDPAPSGYPDGCEAGCGQLGGCAIDMGGCPDLIECDREAVVGMCLAICSEQLLSVFATLEGCDAVLGLAKQSLPDFAAVCP